MNRAALPNLPPEMGAGIHLRGQVGWVLGLALVAGLVACGADDRELRPPSDAQTTTTAPAAPTTPSDGVGTETELVLQLTSAAFARDEAIPEQFTCNGRDVSPPLGWVNLPAGVTELALVVVDVDADGFVHWLVTGIPPTTGGLAEGQVPDGAAEWTNSFGEPAWGGPCPPAGSGTHRYEFRLLALSEPAGLASGMTAEAAFDRLVSLPALAIATYTGTVVG
ncbi:MAG: YbhB/YbcL family Raf kinase inhibitor-like protein [Acidimicrobiales bacterium]